MKTVPPNVELLALAEALESVMPRWVILPMASALTSTAWNGNARSTTAKTIIDMSTVFGAPAHINALLVRVDLKDSGAGATDCYLILSENGNPGSGQRFMCFPANDRTAYYTAVVQTDENGDIYYQTVASGSGTLDVGIVVYGYHLR